MLLWNPVLQRLGLKSVDTSTKRIQNDGPWASGRFGAFQWCEALSPRTSAVRNPPTLIYGPRPVLHHSGPQNSAHTPQNDAIEQTIPWEDPMLLWNPVLQCLGLKPVDTSTKRTQNDGPWASGRFGAFQWCEALSPRTSAVWNPPTLICGPRPVLDHSRPQNSAHTPQNDAIL